MGRKLNKKRLLAILDQNPVIKKDVITPIQSAEPESKKSKPLKQPLNTQGDEEEDFKKAHADIIDEFGSDPELSESENDDISEENLDDSSGGEFVDFEDDSEGEMEDNDQVYTTN